MVGGGGGGRGRVGGGGGGGERERGAGGVWGRVVPEGVERWMGTGDSKCQQPKATDARARTRAVRYALLGICADWVLIGAWKPMP